ncbi:uncharacterized protein LOC119164588 isoform X3 [Rhipicephalus microplus]|uniref:uncharacterized protein LOC119164588 isoform X3 n=1 Tax=Rhipicephalus microplus TaxID=6941 RepID=UPI003F6B5D61
MAARKPTHAYVQYKDGDSAIVSVGLIKHYSPDDVTDLASNKLVCWRKNRKGYLSESYFRGDILTLGCGIDDLVARMRKQGGTVPEQVFEESYQGTRLKKSTLQETKQVRHHSKVLKKYGKGKILGKRRREDSDSETDEEDELVPRRRLQEAEDEIAELEGRLRVSRERLHEERQRNIKLQNLLEHKIDSMEASIIASVKLELRGTRPASQNWQQESPAVRKKLYQLFARNKDWGPVVPRKGMPVAADPPPSQPSRVLPSSLEEQASSQEAVAASSSSSSTNNKAMGVVIPRTETPVAANPLPSQPGRVLPPQEEEADGQEVVGVPSSPCSLNSDDSQQEATAVRREPATPQKDRHASTPRKKMSAAPGSPLPSQSSRVLPSQEEQAGSQEAVAAPSSPRSPNNHEPEQIQPEVDTDAPLFKPLNGKVHIGNGFFITAEKWVLLNECRKDGMFARSLMRCLWKREELVNRSVTGTVCRRFMYQGAKAKPALSPRKHDAIQMAYYHYVKTHPDTMHTVDRRLRDLNKHLASCLLDFSRSRYAKNLDDM